MRRYVFRKPVSAEKSWWCVTHWSCVVFLLCVLEQCEMMDSEKCSSPHIPHINIPQQLHDACYMNIPVTHFMEGLCASSWCFCIFGSSPVVVNIATCHLRRTLRVRVVLDKCATRTTYTTRPAMLLYYAISSSLYTLC